MKSLGEFYGYQLTSIRIQGLSPVLDTNQQGSLLLTLVDKDGIKWQIRPILFDEKTGDAQEIALYHRSKGVNVPLHYQGKSRTAQHSGVQSLLAYIANHEAYEAQKHLKGKRK